MPRRVALPFVSVALLGAAAVPAFALPQGWSPPTTISTARSSGLQPWAASNGAGDLAVAWRARSSRGEQIQFAVRRAGASAFSRPAPILAPVVSIQGVRVAVGAAGQAVVGWRARDSGRHDDVLVASISPSGQPGAVRLFANAKDASGPVNVGISRTGLAAVVWTVRAPGAANRGLGRVRIAIAKPGQGFGPARVLMTRPTGAFTSCVNQSSPDLAARRDGGFLVWWDCDDGVRDFTVTAAQVSPAGAIGAPENTGTVSRGSTRAALLPTPGGAAIGVFSENNDDDAGPNLRSLRRSPAGAWTTGIVPVVGDTSGEPAFSPHVIGGPRVAGTAGVALAGWVDEFGQVQVSPGATATPSLGPALTIAPAARATLLAGVGVTGTASLHAVWTTRPGPGASLPRTLWSATRPAAAAAFTAPEAALTIPQLTGEPVFALGRGGTGVVAWSQGPTTAARVRATVVQVP